MKRNKNILIIFLLLLFFQCSKHVVNNNSITTNIVNFKGNSSTLEIATWNVEHFPKNELTTTYLKDLILELNLDIVVLQEIDNLDSFISLHNSLGNEWVAFRAFGDSNFGRLAYLINISHISVIQEPYNILNADDEYNFAYKLPYVLEFSYDGINFILINVHYKCCGDGILNLNNNSDEEYRRFHASESLHNYIENNYDNENVIILGDMNDLIEDTLPNNVFTPFLNANNQYVFADYDIALGPSDQWSFPNYPSHIDHIIISNEIADNSLYSYNTVMPLVENFFDDHVDYDNYISDHRPVIFNLNIAENE